MITILKSFHFPVAFVLATTLLIHTVHVSAQETSEQQQAKIGRIKKLVDKGGKLFKEKNFAKSAKEIRDAQKKLLALAKSSDESVIKLLKIDYERILKAQKLLHGEGEEFSEMPAFELLKSNNQDSSDPRVEEGSGAEDSEGSDSNRSSTKSEGSVSTDSTMVSFTKAVAPIIVEHCGQCHIQRELGHYSLATYEKMKKKSLKGAVVKPRDIEKSRLITLIESGEMPKKKPRLADEQIQILKDWIQQGAKFDGENKEKKSDLTSFVSTNENSEGTDSDVGNGSK